MFYVEKITIYKEEESIFMKPIISGIILLFGLFYFLQLGLNYLNPKPNALENIEQKLDQAEKEQSVLTENEKKLKTEAQTKEWEEVDEKTIIPLPKPK